jgi:hypothetical protein
MDLKSKHSLLYLYKYPFEFTVGFRTNYFILLHTLQLWQYMLIILTWEFFINFSFFYRASAILQIQKTILCLVFSLTPKEFIKYKFIRIIQYSTLLCSPIVIGLSVCFIRKLI